MSLFHFGCNVDKKCKKKLRLTIFHVLPILRLFTSLCGLYFIFFLARAWVVCFSIKWTWKGIRFIIYGILFSSLPHFYASMTKVSQWHVNIINAPSTFCVVFSSFFIHTRIKYFNDAVLIYGNDFLIHRTETGRNFLSKDRLNLCWRWSSKFICCSLHLCPIIIADQCECKQISGMKFVVSG